MARLTIITPTFNRGNLLLRCFDSLINQTNTDFEWLIIDDGSTDETESVIETCRRTANGLFNITYVKKDNGGKHTAINASHSYIRGMYCLVLDSDDILAPTAVEEILFAWATWENNNEVGRIIFLKADIKDKSHVICYAEHSDVPVDTVIERRIGSTGRDCCDTFRTELFIKYKFPVFPNEKFIGEGSGWFPMELDSKGVYINKAIYYCEYLQEGLTASGRKMRIMNPLGGMFNSLMYMNRRLPIKTRLKKGILFNCYCFFAGYNLNKGLNKNPYKLLTLICRIPGWGLYHYWKRKYIKE